MPPGKGNKEQFKHGFKAQAERKSIELRKQLSLKATDRLPATLLAEHLNVPIYTPQDLPNLSQKNLKELLGKGSGRWSGAVLPLPDNQHLIIHNPNHSSERQESNLMHELAHIICLHTCDVVDEYPGLPSIFRKYDELQENEAKWMGGCLQIPRDGLVWALRKGMTDSDISNHFHASMQMVSYRLRVTAVLIQYERSKKYYGG